jgi:hypothetical protein
MSSSSGLILLQLILQPSPVATRSATTATELVFFSAAAAAVGELFIIF